MSFTYRGRKSILGGKVVLNLTKHGLSSVSVRQGGTTWNSKRGFTQRLGNGWSWRP